MLFVPALPLLRQRSRNTERLGQKTVYADFLNKRVHEPPSVCACWQAVTHPSVYGHVGQPLKCCGIQVRLVLACSGKAGTSLGPGRTVLLPCRAVPSQTPWYDRRREKTLTESRCGDEDCDFLQSEWRRSLQSLKTPCCVCMPSCALYGLNAEIVVPSKTHLIHFYRWCNVTVCTK